MLFIKQLNTNEWWELDRDRMMLYNYNGGHHYIKEEELGKSETAEYNSWHELYLAKHYCPLEVNIRWSNVWISPEGKYYDGDAHENRAEEILEIIYGETDVDWFGDRLEELGWIRATNSLMWEIRLQELENKRLTQKQYDALWDWCELHNKQFPNNVEII